MPYLGSTYIGGTLQATQSITAPTFIGALTGNASTATTLATSRTISLTGDATGSAGFNGGANAAISVTLSNSGVTAGSYGSATVIPAITVDSKGRITAISTNTISTITGSVVPRTGVSTYSGHAAGSYSDAAIYSRPGSEDSWIYCDAANAQYGIYHRNIESALVVAGNVNLPANSIAFVGNNLLTSYICLTDGSMYSKSTITATTFVGALTGNASTASAWATGRTITLTGDVTGTSGAWSGSGNLSFAVEVTDNSHAHTIANVTGLQTALDGKSATTHNHTLDSLSNVTVTANSSGEILKWSGTAWINNTLAEAGIQPAGSYLTTTSSFGGDVSGTYDAIIVADNSHAHTIANVTGLQTALDGKSPTSHTHSTFDRASSVLSGANVFSNLTITDGIVTAVATRAMTKGDLGLGSVENTALSTWAGTSNITTVGTLVSGTIPWTLINNPPSTYAPSAHTLGSHSDVTITSNSSGEILKWNGTAWINNTLAEAGVQATITGAATSITSSNLTASRALVSDASGKVSVSTVTSEELEFVAGVSSAIQTQINDLAGSMASTVIYRNVVTLIAESPTIEIGIPQYNSANDHMLVFENDIYLLNPGTDYTISPTQIVKPSGNFVVGSYTFVLFKNIQLTESLPNDLTTHMQDVSPHSSTPNASAGYMVLRDALAGASFGYAKITNTTKTAGALYAGTTAPNGTGRLNYDGHFYATKVYNAVWNDIADFVEVDDDVAISYGYAYTRKGSKVFRAHKKGQRVLGIASDTYGFGIGKKEEEGKKQIPIAIGGWVLAYVDKPYEFGTPLMVSSKGILTKANLLSKIFHPESIVATYDRVEHEKTWHGIVVNGRHWVKV